MPLKTRSQSKRLEQSKIPHLLPYLEESKYYENADEDSAERKNTSKITNKNTERHIWQMNWAQLMWLANGQ